MQEKQKEKLSTGGASELDPHEEGLTLPDRLERMEDWSRAVVYDNAGNVLATTIDVNLNEIENLLTLFDDEENAFRFGIDFCGDHYDVHRFYETLVYGRKGNSKAGEGICVCKTVKPSEEGGSKDGKCIYTLITYDFPTLSAKTIPALQDFCKRYILPLL
jgi:hypothetical protein